MAAWLTGQQPDKILLMCGINDLNLGATPSAALNNLAALLDEIYRVSPSARVLVSA